MKAFVASNATDSEKIAQLRSELSAATQTEGAHAEALMERIAIREAATLRRIECEVNVARAEAAGKVSIELWTCKVSKRRVILKDSIVGE